MQVLSRQSLLKDLDQSQQLQVVYVVAKNAIQTAAPELEGGEMLFTCLRSLEEARSDIVAGMPTDGILLTGLWYLEHNKSPSR